MEEKKTAEQVMGNIFLLSKLRGKNKSITHRLDF